MAKASKGKRDRGKTEGRELAPAFSIFLRKLVRKGLTRPIPNEPGSHNLGQGESPFAVLAIVLAERGYATGLEQRTMKLTAKGKRLCQDPSSEEWVIVTGEVMQRMGWKIIE